MLVRYNFGQLFDNLYKWSDNLKTYCEVKDGKYLASLAIPGVKKEDLKVFNVREHKYFQIKTPEQNLYCRYYDKLDDNSINITYEDGLLNIEAEYEEDRQELKIN